MAEKTEKVAQTIADPKADKKPTKTEEYKEHLQKIIFQTLDMKVSKSKAWELFKATIYGTVQFVNNLEDKKKKLPLAGVGTFEVLETKPRGSKAGLDKDGNPIEGAEAWPFVPRFRFYASSVIDDYCEFKAGLGDHQIEEKLYGIFAEGSIADEEPTEEKAEKKPAEKAEVTADEELSDEDSMFDDSDEGDMDL